MWARWLLVDVDCSNTFTEGFLLRNGLHEFLILPFSKLSHVRIIHFYSPMPAKSQVCRQTASARVSSYPAPRPQNMGAAPKDSWNWEAALGTPIRSKKAHCMPMASYF